MFFTKRMCEWIRDCYQLPHSPHPTFVFEFPFQVFNLIFFSFSSIFREFKYMHNFFLLVIQLMSFFAIIYSISRNSANSDFPFF